MRLKTAVTKRVTTILSETGMTPWEAAFSPDENLFCVAWAGNDEFWTKRKIQIYNTNPMKKLHTICVNERTMVLCLSETGNKLAFANKSTLSVYTVSAHSHLLWQYEIGKDSDSNDKCYCLYFTHNDKYLYALWKRKLQLHCAATGRVYRNFMFASPHLDNVTTLCLAPRNTFKRSSSLILRPSLCWLHFGRIFYNPVDFDALKQLALVLLEVLPPPYVVLNVIDHLLADFHSVSVEVEEEFFHYEKITMVNYCCRFLRQKNNAREDRKKMKKTF